MSWFINIGINSSNSCGYKTGVVVGENRKSKSQARGRKKPLPLTDDEVRLIRNLKDKGVPHKTIFENHVKGKMTFNGMKNILSGINRCNI